ncbi:MAG TPA: SDR family NAD(P)-dependent oxidoreductase [Actinomycetota bacterium]|nr:SDR family NAD(P)-dependent oxidoreductase [Actinomycetota bacterium]
MKEPVKEKVCVVTGASSGIGRRVAVDLAHAGARVVAVARRAERLVALVTELGGARAGHSHVVADVSRRSDVKGVARHVLEEYGRCDVLINNAGFSNRSRFGGPESVADLQAVMATNFFGTVYCTAELLPLLEASAPSTVVNVASIAGRLAATSSSYCASKFAVVGWSESVRVELASRGIHVGLVLPGPIPTEGFPQTALTRHPLLKYATGTDADVSAAIRDVIEHGKMERTVPRWYYLLRLPPIVLPPIYRLAQRRVTRRFTATGQRPTQPPDDAGAGQS